MSYYLLLINWEVLHQKLITFIIYRNFFPSLMAILSFGNPFTWKKRVHTHLVYECLHRAIATSTWLSLYPNVVISHGSFTCSDHCPITLTTNPQLPRPKALPFRQQNSWAKYDYASTLVRKAWRSSSTGQHLYVSTYAETQMY